MFSSGDNGDEIANTGTRQADYRPPTRWVTAVGGTSLAVGKNNNYLFEQGWGTGKSDADQRRLGTAATCATCTAGAAAPASCSPSPPTSRSVVPTLAIVRTTAASGPHRAVPDVAMVGDPNTGFLIGQSQTFPDGSIQYSEYRIGGTSLSSPLFAGVPSRSPTRSTGGSLGFLNPRLYRAGRHLGLSATSDQCPTRRTRHRRRGPRRLRQRLRQHRRTDHQPAHVQPDRHDLHPARL